MSSSPSSKQVSNDPAEEEVDEADLITPAEAIKRICHYVGSEYEAKLVIADAMHSGRVTVYAGKVFDRSGGDPADEWSSLMRGAEVIGDNILVDVDVWRLSPTWPEETRYWDWDAGNFVIALNDEWVDRPLRSFMEGVRFHRADVMALVGRTDRSGAGGPKPDKVRWAQFWLNILYVYTGKQFDWTQYDNPHQLKQAFQAANDALEEHRRFSDSNIDFAIEMAWEQLVKRTAAERLGRGAS